MIENKEKKITDNSVVENAETNSSPLMSFSVLIEAITLRNNNGLLRNDYCRYRRFCSRKIHRLRNSLNFKCGRNRYTHKPFPTIITDRRYLMIALVSAERTWSFAVQLKSDNAAAQIINRRARQHAIRKFSKTVKYANLLYTFCKTCCDKKTILDAEAYRYLMSGILEMEKQNWMVAVENLKNSHKIYLQLKRISLDNLSHTLIYSKQLEEIEASIRLCKYHLERSGYDCSELGISGEISNFDTQNPEILLEVNSKDSDGILIYKGVQIQSPSKIINRRLKGIVNIIESKCIKIDEKKTKEEWLTLCNDTTPNIIVENYGEVSNLLSELLKSIHSEMLSSESENAKAAWNFTDAYVLDLLNCVEIKRNVLLEILYLQKLKNAFEDETFLRIRHDEGVRYADLLKQSIKKIIDSKSASEDVEVLLLQCLEILTLTRAICLSFFHASIEKYAEAFVLAQWVVNSGEIELPINSLDKLDPYRKIASIFLILQDAVFFHAIRLKCSCLASAVNSDKTAAENKSLHENASFNIENAMSKIGKFPPTLKPIPCRPLLIDLAIFDMKAPDLSGRVKEAKTEGLIGKLKSIWKNF